MKFSPACPRCGSTAGIEMSERKEDVVAIFCASCRITTLIQDHNREQCPDCRADRNNHIDGCEQDRPWAV